MSRIFAAGDKTVLVDPRGRRYLITLKAGGEFHSHAGVLPHDDLIGQAEGVRGKATKGTIYVALRPTLIDFVLKMPRGAQVIYPKDLAPMLMLADIFPGARVLESGVGSGALSMTMLRAGAVITGYELRDDFANRAKANVAEFLGGAALERYRVELRDAYEGVDTPTEPYDRVVLDLPEPWRVVPLLGDVIAAGGVMVAYTPQITQAVQVRQALERGPWIDASTIEVLHRGWHIEGQSVRPDHRMVAHTGFLTSARSLGA
jgi:tRNA (adenine57-N1/adenine58-N1)-methyltransferase